MSRPALFRRPPPEPFILFEPALDVCQCCIAHWRLTRGLALIPTCVGRWLLQEEFGDGIACEPKVAGCCPLALALDQDPGANFISKCQGIHLSFPPLCSNFLSSIADSWGKWLTFGIASGPLL